MSEREVYANAPIVLMVVEIRHSACAPIERPQIAQASALLRSALPLPSEQNEVSVEFQFGPDGTSAPVQSITAAPRWTSRDRRTALTMRPSVLSVETTDYGSYERVRGLLELALRARMAVGAPAGVERIGLRYIDEIRVPSVNSGGRPNWGEWVDPVLLGPSHLGADLGLEPLGNEGVISFAQGSDGAAVNVRYGAQDIPVVQSTAELRRPVAAPGPLFKLDIDSFWQPTGDVPEFDVDTVLPRADGLHEPVRRIFESLITPRLREEVLRHG